MARLNKMTARGASVLFAAVIGVRATAFLFSKLLLVEMGPFMLMGARFLLAFAILAIAFRASMRALTRKALAHGLLLGSLYFVVMGFELVSLTMTASSTVAFLENTAIVFVPLIEALIARKPPTFKEAACTVTAMVGVGFVTLGDGIGSFGFGELLALLAGVFYAIVIIVTARVAKDDDPTALGVLQVGFIGLFGLLAGLAFEVPVLPQEPLQWGYFAVLVVLCTCFGFAFQPMAQSRISAERAAILLAVSPLIAAVLGIVVLGEPSGAGTLFGMALILGGIVASSMKRVSPDASSSKMKSPQREVFGNPRR